MAGSNGRAKRVLVVDDDNFNRDGMRLYLESHGFEVLEAGDEAGAYEVAEREQPDAAVVDIVIPADARSKFNIDHSVGLNLVRRLKELDPSMGIVVFSAHEDRGGEVWNMVRDGMRGIAYLLKGIRPERLMAAIHDTATGRVLLDGIAPTNRHKLGQEILDRLTDEERPWVERAIILMSTLTDQEYLIAQRLGNSQTYQGIAAAMDLALKTVENHITSIYKKLGLHEVERRSPQLRKVSLLAKASMVYDLQNPYRG